MSKTETKFVSVESLDPRKHLLALVAGNIAIGIFNNPSEAASTTAGIAEVAVTVAEEILKRAGL